MRHCGWSAHPVWVWTSVASWLMMAVVTTVRVAGRSTDTTDTNTLGGLEVGGVPVVIGRIVDVVTGRTVLEVVPRVVFCTQVDPVYPALHSKSAHRDRLGWPSSTQRALGTTGQGWTVPRAERVHPTSCWPAPTVAGLQQASDSLWKSTLVSNETAGCCMYPALQVQGQSTTSVLAVALPLRG